MSILAHALKRSPVRKLLLRLSLLALLLALPAVGCANEDTSTSVATPKAPPAVETPQASPAPSLQRRPFQPRVEVVAERLDVPWSLAFAPDGRLLFTERSGRVRVITKGRLEPEPVAVLRVNAVTEAGLMGLALDPDFSRNGYLYVMYTYRVGDQLWNRVSRLTERDGKAADERILLDNLPGGNIHDGGRLKFGPGGKLYITIGDAGTSAFAQQRDTLAGKILRINRDGSIPPDNPFPGSPVYSLGHRNPQGLAWHPVTGKLFETEHGPVGNDEVNTIEAGHNYGWPQVQARAGNPEFVDPILVFSPALAPSGATFYRGDILWEWTGNLFFAALVGQQLHRIVLKAPDFREVESHEAVYFGEYGRLRDVVEGPDGFLYFATNNRDGRGSPRPTDDRILRIVP